MQIICGNPARMTSTLLAKMYELLINVLKQLL